MPQERQRDLVLPGSLNPYFSLSPASWSPVSQNTGPKLFPLQVIDNIPPTLTFFDVTNRLISYQGGKTDVIVKVSDNGLLRLPQVTLTSPDVTQWRYVAGLKSGTYTNGEFQATVPLPANNTDTDVVYKLNGVVQDTERTWSRVQCLKKTKNDDDKKVNYEKAGTGSSLRAFAHLLSFYIHYPVPTRCCYYNSR